MYTAQQIANALDFAVLRPTASHTDIRFACELVRANNIRTVCIAPTYVEYAKKFGAPICAVIGFPHGTTTAEIKHQEALAAMDCGVEEIDVVINYGRFLDDDIQILEEELLPIIKDAHDTTLGRKPVAVKAILETCFYTMQQIDYATRLCVDLGVDFVKTSTGFGLHGATPQAVKAMMQAVEGSKVQVKASGGITSYNDVAKYLDLGCTRLGASRYKELLP
jgi:deoxyribose-phosphate aldolase